MTDADGLVCETRYCPGCGTEIVCNIIPDGELLLYLSGQMDRCIETCPQCRLDLTKMELQDFDGAPRTKGSSSTRKAAGKKDLVDEMLKAAVDEFSSKAAAGRAFDAMRDAFVGLAKTGTDIRWPGIGSFKIKEQKGRNVRNPRTGEIVYVPSKKVLKFTPSKRLKEDLKALS